MHNRGAHKHSKRHGAAMTTLAPSDLNEKTATLLPIPRQIRDTLALALPLILTQLAQIALGTTDSLMVGRLGPTSLAAMAVGGGLYIIVFIFGIGVSHGVMALASQAYGARDPRNVRRFIRQGFWVSLVLAVPIMLLLSQSATFFAILGQPPEIADPASIYVNTIKWALLPGFWYGTLRAFVGAIGRPYPVIATSLIGVVANAILDYGLIFGKLGLPEWGVYGAAFSTVLINILMFAALLTITQTALPFRRYAIMTRFWRADWPKFIEVLRVGVPSGVAVVLEVGFFIGTVFLMGRIGAIETAAHHIALQTAAITFMIPLGISQAATIRVGHAYGRGDMKGVASAGWIAYGLGCLVMAMMGMIFWLLPETIAAVYVDKSDPANAETIALAASFLGIAALFQIFDGAQVIGMGALRGLSDTRMPMIIAAIGYWVIGAAACVTFAFPLGYGAIGIWFGLLTGLGVVAVAMMIRFHRLILRHAGEAP